MPLHRLKSFSPSTWAKNAADQFQLSIEAVLSSQERCCLALSGGSTPAPVFHLLSERKLPWSRLTLIQVDERIAALGSGKRNLVGLRSAFAHLPVEWLPLPVESSSRSAELPDRTELEDGCVLFEARLQELCGSPPSIDIVHLGLGDDGHTASLLPGAPQLELMDQSIAITSSYQGSQRLTLTRPVLDAAKCLLWLVSGANKSSALALLLKGDPSIPAGLIRAKNSLIIADTLATGA